MTCKEVFGFQDWPTSPCQVHQDMCMGFMVTWDINGTSSGTLSARLKGAGCMQSAPPTGPDRKDQKKALKNSVLVASVSPMRQYALSSSVHCRMDGTRQL